MLERVFLAYSRRFFTSKLKHNLPLGLQRSVARGIRVLWYMEQMGCWWVSVSDLSKIGAGQWKVISYVIPDLLTDDLIDEIELERKNGRIYKKYKINNNGLAVLAAAAKHISEEHQKAVSRCAAYRSNENFENSDKK